MEAAQMRPAAVGEIFAFGFQCRYNFAMRPLEAHGVYRHANALWVPAWMPLPIN